VCCSVLQCVAVCCSVLQCVAVCCSVLQYGAVCWSVLQYGAVCCSVSLSHLPTATSVLFTSLQHVAICSNILQHIATHFNGLQLTTTCCNTWYHVATRSNTQQPQCSATHCNMYMLQHIAAHCNILQHAATHCDTLQHTAVSTVLCNTLQHIEHVAPHCSRLRHTAADCDTLPHSFFDYRIPKPLFLGRVGFGWNARAYWEESSLCGNESIISSNSNVILTRQNCRQSWLREANAES